LYALDKYLGIRYVDGKQDCFSVLRDVLRDRWDILLPNFARPTEFWADPNLDMYAMYARWGFKQIFDEAFQVGDVLLMPLGTSRNTHAAMVVEQNQVLHHPPGQLSRLDPLMPRWGRRANIVLRHPKVTEQKEVSTLHLHEVVDAEIFRNPRVKDVIDRAMEAERREMRDHNSRSRDH